MGRPRKAIAELVRQGSPNLIRALSRTPEGQLEPSRPKTPHDLSGEAAEIFEEVVSLLGDRCLESDSRLIRLYAEAAVRAERARRDLEKRGEVLIRTDRYDRQHEYVNPNYRILMQAERELIQLSRELGLSASPEQRRKLIKAADPVNPHSMAALYPERFKEPDERHRNSEASSDEPA